MLFRSYALVIYQSTLGILALIACVGIAYNLSGQYRLGQVQCSMVALAVMYIVIEGDSGYFGGTGMFVAIAVGIISVEVYNFCKNRNIVITLPNSVPDTISDSFTALIPFALNVVLLGGVYLVVKETTGLHLGSALIKGLTPAINVIDSYPVVLLMSLLGSVLWSFGIHGHAVIVPIFSPIIAVAMAENFALVSAGQSAIFHPVFLEPITRVAAFSMWILAPMMIRSKSTTLNAIGKAVILPGLFVMEPVFFGTPIALNFILMIPYILLTVVNFVVFAILYSTGIIPVPFIFIGGITPLGLGYFLQTQNVIGFLYPWIQVLISIPIWIPFFKIYEKQIIEEEQQVLLEVEKE